MNNKIKVTLEDSREISVDYKTKAIDAIKLIQNDVSNILGLKINNEVEGFDYELVTDSQIEFIRIDSSDGYLIYSRTLKMVLYMALTSLYSSADVDFMATVNRDQYFTISNVKITDKKVLDIKNKMIEIINNDYPIIKKIVGHEEATILYKEANNVDKLENLSTRLKENVAMYFCQGMYNYFYGLLAPSTGCVKVFDLIRYKDGLLLVFPDKDMNINKEIREDRLYDTFIKYNELGRKLGAKSNISDLNESILNGKINNIIQVSEAIHQRNIVELVLDIEKRKDVKMILIAGPSSSGKTTFAQKLGVQLRLTGFNPVTISMDNYFVERKDTPLGEDGKYNFECVEALDIELFNTQMKELIEGKTVELPEFDFIKGTKNYNGKYLKMGGKDILIIEGIHALNPILTKFTKPENKYKIYIAPIATLNLDGYTKVSSTDTRILRRMVRDYSTRGHSVERTFELWKNVKKGEEEYIFPFVNSVDYIFNSSLVYEPNVMRTFAQPLLLQIDRNSIYYSEARRLYEFLNNFLPMETTNIPVDSIVREFIGNGCFYR